MKKLLSLLGSVVILSIGVLSGCTQQQTTPSPNTVSINNYAFNPVNLTVANGTKVTWINNQNSIPHQVVSDTGLFESAQLSTGQSFNYTFTNVGIYKYHCGIHPYMHGTITVI